MPTERLKNVVDATGAGDAFLGGLITGIMTETSAEKQCSIVCYLRCNFLGLSSL